MAEEDYPPRCTRMYCIGERKMRPRGDRKSQEFTQLLQKTFEASVLTSNYPRSQLDIYCEILQSDGGFVKAAVPESIPSLTKIFKFWNQILISKLFFCQSKNEIFWVHFPFRNSFSLSRFELATQCKPSGS